MCYHLFCMGVNVQLDEEAIACLMRAKAEKLERTGNRPSYSELILERFK